MASKIAPFQKLLTVLASGKQVTIEEIEKTVGKEIHMYRLSTYIWHIKTNANGIVKAIKDGRKVVAYQIVNAKEMKDYLSTTGVVNYKPGSTQIKASVSKLSDLKSKPLAKKVSVKKTKDVVVEESAEVATAEVDVIEVTEVTE
jgi:hypothetical protein